MTLLATMSTRIRAMMELVTAMRLISDSESREKIRDCVRKEGRDANLVPAFIPQLPPWESSHTHANYSYMLRRNTAVLPNLATMTLLTAE